jgi:hypothetical protein
MCGVRCGSEEKTRELTCNPFGIHEEKRGSEVVVLYRTVSIS